MEEHLNRQSKKRARLLLVKAILAFGIILLVVFVSIGNGNGSATWMTSMQLNGERFTVAELVQDRVIATNDCMPEIEFLAAAVRRSLRWSGAPAVDQGTPPPGQRRVGWAERSLIGYDGRHLSWETAEQEIAILRDPLNKVHRALNNPTRDPGWDYSMIPMIGSPGNFVAKRVTAQTLGNAMLIELRATNVVAAQQHLDALVSMVRVHDQGWTLVNQMIRVAIIGLAADATWAALQAPGWTEPQLQKLQQAWRSHDLIPAMARTLEIERAAAILYFDSVRKRNGGSIFSIGAGGSNSVQLAFEKVIIAPVYELVWSQGDKLFYLQCMQTFIETLRDMSNAKSWKAVRPAIDSQFEDYMRRQTGFFGYRYPMTRQIMPNILKALTTMTKNQTLEQLALAALAIKRYELGHGELPSDLKALIPDYLSEMPTDYWDGQPLRYRKIATGTFLLYSCGEDLRDNGCSPSADTIWEAPIWPDHSE